MSPQGNIAQPEIVIHLRQCISNRNAQLRNPTPPDERVGLIRNAGSFPQGNSDIAIQWWNFSPYSVKHRPIRKIKTSSKVAKRDIAEDRKLNSTYDASSIEVLEGLEPVRKRPGMYIGGTDERAMHHLFAEVLDNSMDEAVAGHANRIEVLFHDDFSVTVKDNGRGIPVDPHPKFPNRSALEVILCTLHAGAKFSGKTYQTAGGLHGVGVSVVNALSERLRVEIVRNRKRYTQEYARGGAHDSRR